MDSSHTDSTHVMDPADDVNAYGSLAEDHDDDARWAYGTGFADVLTDVDRAAPPGVDAERLGRYALALADDALILSHRLSEWCSRAPELEEDVALANIALDLLGQARMLLTRAGELAPGLRPANAPTHIPAEDALAYFRDEREFRNVRLAEIDCGPGPGGDFATTIARLLVFSCWRIELFSRLCSSPDPVLSAIAAKGVKELAYHRDHAARWTVRLGDGTAESHRRMCAALIRVWPYLEELLTPSPVENGLGTAAVDPTALRAPVDSVLAEVLSTATLSIPDIPALAAVPGGREGVHSREMGFVLAEFQHLARSHPEADW